MRVCLESGLTCRTEMIRRDVGISSPPQETDVRNKNAFQCTVTLHHVKEKVRNEREGELGHLKRFLCAVHIYTLSQHIFSFSRNKNQKKMVNEFLLHCQCCWHLQSASASTCVESSFAEADLSQLPPKVFLVSQNYFSLIRGLLARWKCLPCHTRRSVPLHFPPGPSSSDNNCRCLRSCSK